MSSFDNMSVVPVITPEVMRLLLSRSAASRTNSWKQFCTKFQSVCVILFYLACIVRLPARTMAAPLPKAKLADGEDQFGDNHEDAAKGQMSLEPYWINPCGLNVVAELVANVVNGKGSPTPASSLNDAEIVMQTMFSVQQAIRQFDTFKEDYAQKLFHLSWEEYTNGFGYVRIPWLPKEDIRNEDVTDLPTALKSLYLTFQQIAVSLEQTVMDSAIDEDDFYLPLKQTENRLRAVLCELQAALLEKQIQPEPDAQRSLMNNEFREISKGSASTRHFRDYVVLNQYHGLLNFALEYFTQLTKSTQA